MGAKVANLDGVEAGGRLVHNDDRGIVKQAVGHSDPLSQAFRQLAHRFVENHPDVTLFAHCLDPLCDNGRAQSPCFAEEPQHFERGHVPIQRAVFRQVSNQRGRVEAIPLDVVTPYRRVAIGGRDEPGEQSHDGRLARAVEAEKGDNLTGSDLERHVLDRDESPVVFAEPAGFDNRFGWRIPFHRLMRPCMATRTRARCE